MARAPDKRIEQAKGMYLKGMKLVEIASQLNLPEGTVRSWKNRYNWEIKMRPVRREIRMQLRQESLKLSFLIVWIQKKNG